MSTSTYDIQRAVYGVLSPDPVLATQYSAAVYDDVPENAAFPYITLGEWTETDDPKTLDSIGRESTFTVHIWSRARGMAEVQNIAGRIIQILEHQPLSLGIWRWEATNYADFRTLRDMDGISRHGVLRFRVRSRRDF